MVQATGFGAAFTDPALAHALANTPRGQPDSYYVTVVQDADNDTVWTTMGEKC
ncbi:hypothetical protein [Prescottella agglutinans]|uniref:hypothetical protein n=1 Tax=Prescottella agglutinans TaxID=1644129 RepID=UPI003D969722